MSIIAARLERIPFNNFHKKLLLMGGFGFMFEAVDALIVGFIMPVIRTKWGLTSFETGLIGSSTYVGFFFGAIFAGMFGDRFGRKLVMMWALAIFCVLALINAFVNDWHTFMIMRALGGIGMGAEGAIIAPYLSEFISRKYRGMFTAALAGFFSVGFVLAALIGYLVIPVGPDGWRYTLIISAAPVIMLLWWRRSLVESPRWLESKGRLGQAERVVSMIEQQAIAQGLTLPSVDPTVAASSETKAHLSFFETLRVLWRRPHARMTAVIWLLWLVVTFCSYAFNVWIPGLLVQKGMTITKSFGYSIAIYVAMLPGYLSASYLNEKIGRKPVIVGFLSMSVVAAACLALSETESMVILFSIALSFVMNGAVAGQYAYTPEVFPTEIRATGMGAASAFGRIGAIAAPMLVGYLYPIAGFPGVFGLATGLLALGAVVVLLFGVETRGLSLERIATMEDRGHTIDATTPGTPRSISK